MYEARKLREVRVEAGTNSGVDSEHETEVSAPPYTPVEWARALALGLDTPLTEKVAQLLAQTRREAAEAWVERMERVVTLQRELRAQRDAAEARIARAERVAQARSYLRPGTLEPRFVLSGHEVLAALKGDP